jgi:hypothetical protein
MGGGPGGAGVGDWGSGGGGVPADGWTYERLLELDEAVVKKGGMPVSKVRAVQVCVILLQKFSASSIARLVSTLAPEM